MSSEGLEVALTNCQYVQGARAWAPVYLSILIFGDYYVSPHFYERPNPTVNAEF